MWPGRGREACRARIREQQGGKSRLVALSPVLIDALLPDTGANVVSGDERVYTAATSSAA